jgi:hypothetical protein
MAGVAWNTQLAVVEGSEDNEMQAYGQVILNALVGDRIALGRILPGVPHEHGVRHAAGHVDLQSELGVLLDERGLIGAGDVAEDDLRLGVSDLQQVGAVIGGSGRHQVVPDLLAAQLVQQASGDAGQVVAEGVIGGENVEGLVILVLDQVAADGLHVLGVRGLGAEGVVVALPAADLVGVRPGVEEDLLVALGHVHDGQRDGAAHGAEEEVTLSC